MIAWPWQSPWKRYREIAQVLAQHGFVMVLDKLGLSRHLSLKRRWFQSRVPDDDADWGERIGLALAALGPTYVKLGQLASTRTDLLPDKLVRALERLQSDVPPFGFDVVIKILEAAWGRPLADVMGYINPAPLAAASLGQVHQGRLLNGQRVVIKVRRPDVVPRTESDLKILKGLGDLVQRRTEWADQYHMPNLIAELSRTLREELNFSQEAKYTDRAWHTYNGRRHMRIPRVIWEWTRSDVLVMEEMTGTKITEFLQNPAISLGGREMAQRFVGAVYYQIFIEGFFHADPHPGNIHVDDQGRIMFLDWGMVGMLSPDMRRHSVALILGLSQGRPTRIVDALLDLGAVEGNIERGPLTYDVEQLRRRYYESELEDFNLGQAFGDLLSLAKNYNIRIPSEYALLAKTAMIVDGVVRQIDAHTSLLDLGKAFGPELLMSRIEPNAWIPGVMDTLHDWSRAAATLPAELNKALATLSRGEVRIVLEHKNLDKVLGHWERLVNRLALSFLLAALIVGSGLVVHRDHLDHMARFPFGEYAFIAASLMALWVIIGAMRRGKL